MFCEHCGTGLEKDALFCQNCGRKVTSTSTTHNVLAQTPAAAPLSEAIFYSADWRRRKVFAVASLPYMDIMIDKDNFYAIKMPLYKGSVWGFFIGLLLANIIGMVIGAAIGASKDTKKRKWYRTAWINNDILTSSYWTNEVFLKVALAELKNKIEFGKNKLVITHGEQKLVLQKSKAEVERLHKFLEKYVL